MKPIPRLTIGLPVYNGQDFLPQALDALLGQSFRDFELIISDNASTDGTEEVCRRYAAQDDRIRYHRQPRNVGISAEPQRPRPARPGRPVQVGRPRRPVRRGPARALRRGARRVPGRGAQPRGQGRHRRGRNRGPTSASTRWTPARRT